MAVYSPKNEYQGINAHLQSQLQQPGENWEGFHQGFVISLLEVLGKQLPENYYADVEQSLQIKTQSKPDVLISRRPTPTEKPIIQSAGHVQGIVFLEEVVELEDWVDYFPALVIYQRHANQDIPVTRIEVLSPANKPPHGSHRFQYLSKRVETLAVKLNLVEIDFLHEQPPIDPLKRYIESGPAKPYYAAVTQPVRLEGTKLISNIVVYSWGVDEPIPEIEIPLQGKEVVHVEIGTAYNMTFERTKKYMYAVDYSQLPINFAAYSPADQDRIRARMQAVTQNS